MSKAEFATLTQPLFSWWWIKDSTIENPHDLTRTVLLFQQEKKKFNDMEKVILGVLDRVKR